MAKKLTMRDRADLQNLIDHVFTDISYDAGGTFALNPGMNEKVDKKAVDSAHRAIRIIRDMLYG